MEFIIIFKSMSKPILFIVLCLTIISIATSAKTKTVSLAGDYLYAPDHISIEFTENTYKFGECQVYSGSSKAYLNGTIKFSDLMMNRPCGDE